MNGKVMIYPSFDTLQVKDYTKDNMAAASEQHKIEVHERQFPVDLEQAFSMGATLSKV